VVSIFYKKYRDAIYTWWKELDKAKVYIFISALALISMVNYTGYVRLITIILGFFYTLDLLNRWSSRLTKGKHLVELRNMRGNMRKARDKRTRQSRIERGDKH